MARACGVARHGVGAGRVGEVAALAEGAAREARADARHCAGDRAQRLVALDYLLVHTGDLDGPENLHPPTPTPSAEMLVRRKLVEQSLLLMMTRDLVAREVTADGIKYGAGENATTFLSSVSSNYLVALKERATWLVEAIGGLTDEQFKSMMRRFFDKWVEEFHHVEQSLGGEA